MANPFLVLGGIAVGVITAAFGVLAVPGWVASAQDAAAQNDLGNIVAAQSAAMAEGRVVTTLDGLSGGDWGANVTLSAGVDVELSANAQSFGVIAVSQTGRAYGRISGGKAHEAESRDALLELVPFRCEWYGAGLDDLGVDVDLTQCDWYVPPRTTLAYTVRCDVPTTVYLPVRNPNGTVTWSDDQTAELDGAAATYSRALAAGTTYKLTYVGTAGAFNTPDQEGGASAGAASRACYRSVDTWTSDESASTGENAFAQMVNLTSVPSSIPAITSAKSMFAGATSFNASLASWDMSKVTSTASMFEGATAFNRPVSGWSLTSVTDSTKMFRGATSFAQDAGATLTRSNAVGVFYDAVSTITPRCQLGQVVVSVRVDNKGESPMTVAWSTPYGSKTASVISAPTGGTSTAANARATSIPAGAVTFTITTADGTRTITGSYPALSC